MVRFCASTTKSTPPGLERQQKDYNRECPSFSFFLVFVQSPHKSSTMSSTTTVTKSNVGVYTNPAHDLWVGESQPSLESIKGGESLKDGQVTIGIKSTGICGYKSPSPQFSPISQY